MKRGVVGSPGLVHRIPGGFKMERSISAEELRFYILYWDHVAIPGNNLIYIGIPDEEEMLACGAISRPRVNYNGAFQVDQVTDAVLACQSIVASEFRKAPDIDWVIHQFGGDLLLPPALSKETDVLRLNIASVLPVPPTDEPIAEVLEFKERRRADLDRLHRCLDELYLDILRTPDVDFGSRKLLGEFKGELESLGTDKRDTSRWSRFDLTVEFSAQPKDVIAGLSAGAALDLTAGMAIPVATAIGGVASLLDFRLSKSQTLGPTRGGRLAYLTSAKSERLLR